MSEPRLAHARAMRAAAEHGVGFDLVIVTTGSPERAAWWRARLAATRTTTLRADARLVVLDEPWPAGTALGTLLAVTEAGAVLGESVLAWLERGAAVALVHTAGAGERMRAHTAALDGDKARVPLPAAIAADGCAVPITALEAVLRQIGPLAPLRTGRLSVFWADQILIPSIAPTRSDADAVITARPLPAPSADVWRAHHLHRYGVLAVDAAARPALIEKVSFDAFSALGLDASGGFYVSLGAFHVGAGLLASLTRLHHRDLVPGRRLDTDRGWWMALTLAESVAARLGLDRAHHRRLAPLREPLRMEVESAGHAAWWWDLGAPASYSATCAACAHDDDAGRALRHLLG